MQVHFASFGVVFQALREAADLVCVARLVAVILMLGNPYIAFSLCHALANLFGALSARARPVRPYISRIRIWFGQYRQRRQTNRISNDRCCCCTSYRAKERAPVCGRRCFPLFHVPHPFFGWLPL